MEKNIITKSKYDIGDKVFAMPINDYCMIKGIIISCTRQGYTISYTTTGNVLLRECEILETKPTLLDDYEKRFLRNILVPLNAGVIIKHREKGGYGWLEYSVGSAWYELPPFKSKEMYVGLEFDKAYNIKELELDKTIKF